MKIPIPITSALVKHWRLALEAVVLAGVLLYGACKVHKLEKANGLLIADKVKLERVVAQKAGAIEGTQTKTIVSKSPKINDFIKKEKEAGAKPVAASDFTVKFEDTAKSVSGPSSIEDEYGRFHFDLPSGLLKRKQTIGISSVIIRSLDGQYNFTKTDIREFSQIDGSEIPSEGIEIKGTFQFFEEQPVKQTPKLFHPRLVALVDHRGSFGAGAELLNVKDRVTLGVAGTYNVRDKTVDLAVFPTVRLLNTNVSVGASYSPFTKAIAGILTIQLTR